MAAFVLLLGLLGALIATVVIVVPVARIVLVPELVSVDVDVPLVADQEQASVDAAAGRIPAPRRAGSLS